MNWDQVSSILIALLAIFLVVKLYRANLMRRYFALCIYFLYQAFVSVVWLFMTQGTYLFEHYSSIYCILMGLGWPVTLAIVFNLLKRSLESLPGIVRLSQAVLKLTFGAALLFGCFSLIIELSATHIALISRIVSAVLGIERVVSTVALLTFIGTLTFLFWFKVQMSRNLVVLNIGFVLYFAFRDIDYLCQVILPSKDWDSIVKVDTAIAAVCYLAWIFLLNEEGDRRPVELGSNWDRSQQNRIIHDLESLNRTLSRHTQHPV